MGPMDRSTGGLAADGRYDDVRTAVGDTMEGGGTWLCPTEVDRARFVEMGGRHRWAYVAVGATMVVVLGASARWLGPGPLVVMAIAMAVAGAVELAGARSRHPEVGVALALLVLQAGVLVSIHRTGGVSSPVLPWAALLVPTLAARFPSRVVLVGTALTVAGLIVTVGLGDTEILRDDPSALLFSLSIVIVVAAVGITMGASDRTYRNEAAIDPLTGLLNRASLPERFEELAAQARLSGGGLSLVVCDIDHFKAVNDNFGHDRGDEVLRATADEVRRSFRQFELIYRIGGEELLIVLPGTGLTEGVAAAERIRRRVEAARPGGLDLTVSCGVAAAAGDGLDFASLFSAADGALYAAKREGRNRVVAAPSVTAPLTTRPSVERRRSA